MSLVRRLLKTILCSVALASAAACTNLGAVRDFASSSSKLTGYTDVTNRYISSAERIERQIPDGPEFEPDRQAAPNDRAELAAQKQSLLKLHTVTTGYMAALALLAGDDSFDLSPEIDKVTGVLAASPELGIDAAEVQAYGSIVSKVVSWGLAARQAREVRVMVTEYGPNMDVMLRAMETSTTVMLIRLKSERERLLTFEQTRRAAFMEPTALERPAPPGTADPDVYERDRQRLLRRNKSTLAWAQRGYTLFDADESKAIASATALVEGIKVVRTGHGNVPSAVERGRVTAPHW